MFHIHFSKMFVLTDIYLDINYNIILFNDSTTVEFNSICRQMYKV